MNLAFQRFTLSFRLVSRLQACSFSTNAKIRDISRAIFRTDVDDPAKQCDIHHGLFYNVPKEIANRLFLLGAFDREQQATMKVFQETAIMVRKPALEVIDLLNRTDFSRPPNAYVLYGPMGSGKTFTLNHLLHYGFNQKFVLVHCPRPTDWINWPQEQAVSASNSKRIDTPLDAAVWLQNFKAQNFHLVEQLKLTSKNKYTWSQREHTEPGDTLMSIVDHGISRIKHASDCMAVLLKELRMSSAQGECRLLILVDKVNAFYEPSRLLFPDRTYATVDDITIARAFKKFFKKNWENGALIAAVCKKLVVPYRLLVISGICKKEIPRDRTHKQWGPFDVTHLSDYPKALLTEDGFQDFDPFIPIEVSKYSDKEFDSCLDYYQDRHWLQRPASKTQEGRDEMKFLSGQNPGQLYTFCSSL